MKVLQAIHSYKPYLTHFENKYKINRDEVSFEELKALLLKDRFYAAHLLDPVLNDTESGFYTMWDYPLLQQKWAESKGWNETDLKKILFAQIEEFKPDVFYNCSPIRFDASEINTQISPKILKVCWFASPETKHIDFTVYKTRLTNLPPDVQPNSKLGFRSDLFQPAHDPIMDEIINNTEKSTDIFFYGQYSRSYFKKRNAMIDQLLTYKKKSKFKIELALQTNTVSKSSYPFSRPTRLKKAFPRKIIHPSKLVIKNSIQPLYGLDLYKKIASSKIVFNAAVDFSGKYKVNMRNFESLGLGAHLISNDGIYLKEFIKGKQFSVYSNFHEFINIANYMLNNSSESQTIAKAGNDMVKNKFF